MVIVMVMLQVTVMSTFPQFYPNTRLKQDAFGTKAFHLDEQPRIGLHFTVSTTESLERTIIFHTDPLFPFQNLVRSARDLTRSLTLIAMPYNDGAVLQVLGNRALRAAAWLPGTCGLDDYQSISSQVNVPVDLYFSCLGWAGKKSW